MATPRLYGVLALLSLSACLNPTREPDCLLDGTCECKTRADCTAEADCVDGRCFVKPDAGLPGELGWPCTQDEECLFGPCLPRGPGNGNVCSAVCATDGGFGCDKGYQCKQAPSGVGFLCVPPIRVQCLGCSADSDCNALGDRCSPIGDAGTFCTTDCALTGQCPEGHVCRSLVGDGGVNLRQCIPQQNSCDCSVLTAGLTRSCSQANPRATCFGVETCGADGTWSTCDAPAAAQEICDGIDNDCDGLTDQADPDLITAGLPGYPSCNKGACSGQWSCRGSPDAGYAFSCSAPEPKAELCNRADDDCNGVIDDGLVDSTGAYVGLHACGSCATDCTEVLKNLAADGGTVLDSAASCDLISGTRTCVPRACAKGYFLSPPGSRPQTCQKSPETQCRPCTTAADCSVPDDVCIKQGTDPETSCAQSCEPSSTRADCTGTVGSQECCPTDTTCQLVGAAKVCVPRGASCQCNPTRIGASRACFLSSGVATCVGRQTCSAQGYGACDTSATSVEICDGFDNDCDGDIDEDFIDTRRTGTYDSDEHCGSCTTSCPAQWSPTIQHANGICEVVGAGPHCAIGSCTRQKVAGGALCRLDSECPTGLVCNTTFFQCVRPCTGNAGCAAGDTCVDSTCQHACTTNAQCSAFGPGAVCSGNVCGYDYQFVNADQEDTNGCECASNSSVVDAPELFDTYPPAGTRYVDRNCDETDGVAARSLFVWAQSTSSLGTRDAPFKTIGEAIAAFNAANHSTILVAQGTYAEQVILKNGIEVYGGYSSDFAKRDIVLFPTFIEAVEPTGTQPRGTINAENLSSRTVIAGFTIRGYDVNTRPAPGTQGTNSFAIYVRNSAGLIIQNNHVVGGRGGDGSAATPGSAGSNGGAGASGVDARECNTASCANESQNGGLAGSNAACPGQTTGNPGGRASPVGFNQQQQYTTGGINGAGGFDAQYADGVPDTFCKYDCFVPSGLISGSAALNGGDGSASTAGRGCAGPRGALVNGDWATAGGTAGSDGAPGRGGGGGGAGGCVENNNDASCTVGRRVGDLGATGGGGGAGGCGGTRGIAGAGGGGSFAVFVVGAAPTIKGNVIDFGFGGIGGNGGTGGYGGLGGQGGRGGFNTTAAWCAGQGGAGGRGGNGGAGSGGGAGCGGSVFGIAGEAISGSNYASLNTIPMPSASGAGTGGIGGASPAGTSFKGGDGISGVVSAVESF